MQSVYKIKITLLNTEKDKTKETQKFNLHYVNKIDLRGKKRIKSLKIHIILSQINHAGLFLK